MTYGVWDAASLKNVSLPMLLVAGSQDDVLGYEKGVRTIWQGFAKDNAKGLRFESLKKGQ